MTDPTLLEALEEAIPALQSCVFEGTFSEESLDAIKANLRPMAAGPGLAKLLVVCLADLNAALAAAQPPTPEGKP